MDSWQLILSPETTGAVNMAADLDNFTRCEAGEDLSVIRIYSWKPKCISFGYAQKVVREEGWEVVRRPTGGGIVYHEAGEVSYSIVTRIDDPALPEGLIPSYLAISKILVDALISLGVEAKILNTKLETLNKSQSSNVQNLLCFAQAMEYEIVSGGKKIVGSAQKRGRRAMLQQGTIKLDERFDFAAISGALVKAFKKWTS